MKTYYQRKDGDDIVRIVRNPKRPYHYGAIHTWDENAYRWRIIFSCTWETPEKVEQALRSHYPAIFDESAYTPLAKKPANVK